MKPTRRRAPEYHQPPVAMLYYAIAFLIIALIAGWLGFGSLAGTAALIAKICLGVFLVLAVLAFLRSM